MGEPRLRVRSAAAALVGQRLLAWFNRRVARSAAWTGQQRASLRLTIALVLLAVLVLRNGEPTLAGAALYGLCLAALLLPFIVGPRAYTVALVVCAVLGASLARPANDLLIFSLVLIGMAGSQLPVLLAAPASLGVAAVFALAEYRAGAPGALLQAESWFAATFAGAVAAHGRRVAAARQTAMLAELAQANAELRHAHEQLRLDSQRAAELAAAEERERIAREVHDVLAHTLTILVVQVG
ncbi:MAG TPA: histidine kinase, partial [Chloroflexota bacterium]|nr:histidine kinase [Chloroflexota bacterium]